MPRQKDTRLSEIQEIESIQKDLARRDIYVGNRVLQKAIIFDNERDIIKQYGTVIDPETGAVKELPELEVKYPNQGDQLLVNPFAVVKKEKGGKKKSKK